LPGDSRKKKDESGKISGNGEKVGPKFDSWGREDGIRSKKGQPRRREEKTRDLLKGRVGWTIPPGKWGGQKEWSSEGRNGGGTRGRGGKKGWEKKRIWVRGEK